MSGWRNKMYWRNKKILQAYNDVEKRLLEAIVQHAVCNATTTPAAMESLIRDLRMEGELEIENLVFGVHEGQRGNNLPDLLPPKSRGRRDNRIRRAMPALDEHAV